MGQNLGAGGFGCCQEESEEFESFLESGGQVRVLIISLNYPYCPGNELNAISDGINFEKMAHQSRVDDVTFMRDDAPPNTPLFPTAQNVIAMIRKIGQRCRPQDYFVFFFAGHGENVEDAPPYDEEDGFDEAFCTPSPNFQLRDSDFLIDDQFAMCLEASFHRDTKMLVLCDCCHSASICDIDSRVWSNHKICSISACLDYQTSVDTGKGGFLTISMEKAVADLAIKVGDKEYSVQTMFNRMTKYGKRISTKQTMNLMHANFDPELVAWPLPRPWWR